MSKTVVITGASRGIGKETAILFAKAKYNVIINYFKSEKEANRLHDYLHQQKVGCLALKADISDYGQVKNMIEQVEQKFGKIDVLVNNAGISTQKLFTDIEEPEWDRTFDVNIKGMFNCCKNVVPMMVREKYGKIINISSILGISGASCEVHYSASKAAVIGFTKALSKELGPSNINVNCVAPGMVDTDMNSSIDEITLKALKENTSLRRMGSCKEIANTILFLADDKSSFITGQVISPNGGLII